MPAKRRIGKARGLHDYRRQQLLEGPDACLLAGVGYLWSIRGATFDQASPEEQAVALAEMREDWARYGREMLERWTRGEREPTTRPWVYPYPGSPDRLPWAAEAFGEPQHQQSTSG
jgi:hypothetical protein